FFFSSRRRHTRFSRDWSSDVCSSDLQRSKAGTGISCAQVGRSTAVATKRQTSSHAVRRPPPHRRDVHAIANMPAALLTRRSGQREIDLGVATDLGLPIHTVIRLHVVAKNLGRDERRELADIYVVFLNGLNVPASLSRDPILGAFQLSHQVAEQ